MAEVSYDIPQDLPDASRLAEAADRLVAIPEAASREEAALTVFKLVDAVLAAPEDVKKRKLRKANDVFHRKVGRHRAAIDFLVGVGFKEIDDPDAPGEAVLSMPVAYMSRLTDAHHTLALVTQRVGIVAPPLPSTGFNPFRADVQKTDMSKNVKGAHAWREQADRLHNEVKEMEQELQQKVEAAPLVELRPIAFWIAAGRRLEEVIQETANQPTDDPTTDNALLVQVASAKSAFAGANGNFESADKRRLADLSRQRVHGTCVLRVICPDKSVLQANFRSGDKGERVIAQLGPLLAPHVRKAGWYIYQSPPMKRLLPAETLSAAGLTPGANMYLGFDGERPEAPYLISNLMSQLGPLPKEVPSGESDNWGKGMSLGGAGSSAGGAKASSVGRSASFSVKAGEQTTGSSVKAGEQTTGSAAGNPRWFRAPETATAKDAQGNPRATTPEQAKGGQKLQGAGPRSALQSSPGGLTNNPSDSSACTGGPRRPEQDTEQLVVLQDAVVSPGWLFSCMPSCYKVEKPNSKLVRP